MAEDYRVTALIAECERRGMEDVQSTVRSLVEKIQQKKEEKAAAAELRATAAGAEPSSALASSISDPAAAIAEPTEPAAPLEPQPEKAHESSSG